MSKLRRIAVIGAVSAMLLGMSSVAHATKASPRKTATNAFACTYAGTKGVDETLKGISKISITSLREQGWSGKVARWLPGTVNRTYVVGLAPMSPVPTVASCPPAVGAPAVQPAGTSDFSTSTEMIFVDFPLNQVPADVGFEYLIDGVSLGGNFIGYAYPGRGTHVLTLKVGGVLVDTDTFVIG
jgi:hypothetical protein